jgi:ketosteroid isomerase-like protein
MSQANVEVVRAVWAAWEHRDMTAVFALYDPEIVWDQTHAETGELTAEYRGHEGVRTFLRTWWESFESYWAYAEEFIDAGEAVVVRCRQGGRGKQSGVEVEMPPYWQVYRVKDGLVSQIVVYLNEADALNAVELEE